ncbi:MAG: hypothetical protein Q8O66_01405 [bacterium]|nr:hypothetical protein [bacterium]
MKKIIFSAIIVTLLSFTSFQSVLAIGMMTQPIVIKDILRGQEMLIALTLFNSADKEETYGLKAEGQITNWVSFYKTDDKDLKNPITEINMPIKDFFDVKIKFSVPKDMPNGKYTGKILAFLASSGEITNDQTSVDVSQQVSRDVTITVTDKETVQLKASFIPATYDVQQGKPMKIRVMYDNQGNVAVKPDLQLKITKSGTTVYNAIFPYPEEEEAVRAYVIKEISPIEWQTTGQENGKYNAELKVFLNGVEIQKESFGFSIGYLGFDFLSALALIGGGNLTLAWFLIGMIFVILAVIFTTLNKKGVNLEKVRVVFGNLRKLF